MILTIGDTVMSDKNLKIAEIACNSLINKVDPTRPFEILLIVKSFIEAKAIWENKNITTLYKSGGNEQSKKQPDKKKNGWFPGDCYD